MIIAPKILLKIIQIEQLKSSIIDRAQKALLALAIFAIALVIAVAVARISKKWLTSLLNRSRVRDDLLLKSFFLRTLTLMIYVLSILTALGTVGLDVRTFIAGLGITGLIIGFGLRDILSNFAAGLLLLIYRPFRAGELIEVEGSQGVVEELTIVNMEMTTNDGVRVIMPNSKVWGAKITNYSLSQRRRVELNIKVREECAEDSVTTILSALRTDDRILSEPPPSVKISSISDDAATLVIWVWVLPREYNGVNADAYIGIKRALIQADIPIL
jgi:small conductance mechanosensitive channel